MVAIAINLLSAFLIWLSRKILIRFGGAVKNKAFSWLLKVSKRIDLRLNRRVKRASQDVYFFVYHIFVVLCSFIGFAIVMSVRMSDRLLRAVVSSPDFSQPVFSIQDSIMDIAIVMLFLAIWTKHLAIIVGAIGQRHSDWKEKHPESYFDSIKKQ